MYKKSSPLNPIIICSLILLLISESIIFSVKLPQDELIEDSVFMGLVSIFWGGILGIIVYYLFLKPSKSQLLLQKQTELLEKGVNSTINNAKVNKIDALGKLTELRKSGTISEEEFYKLKKEIIDEK